MKRLLLVGAFTFTAATLAAQRPFTVNPNITTLIMGTGIANGFVPPPGPSRVRVPPGEYVMMTFTPISVVPGQPPPSSFQWRKDGQPIPGATSTTFIIPEATTADRGLYTVTGFSYPIASTGIDLDVVAEGHIGNLSARVELTPTGAQVLGFNIGGKKAKEVLYRVVGPSLKNFGVASPATHPTLQCFDATGHLVAFSHPAVLIDVNALFQSVGAFPVDATELPTISFDYGALSPGSYTLVINDAAKTGGTALVEVYEMN